MWRWTLAIASGLLLAAGPASAVEVLMKCQRTQGAEGIAACTAAIESGKHTGWNLAIAYGQRGIYYREAGDCTRAIPDLDKSLVPRTIPLTIIRVSASWPPAARMRPSPSFAACSLSSGDMR